MSSRCHCAMLLGPAIVLLLAAGGRAATSVSSPRAQAIAGMIWNSTFVQAVDSSRLLIAQEPDNPVGYVLLGITYRSMGCQYRNNGYSDSITRYLDSSITLAEASSNPAVHGAERYFIVGSAYGYLALEQSVQGHWWGAFKDGHRSCTNLEKALSLDSSFIESFLGIGDYHYWKSAKSKIITWLPFVGDKRKQGIAEVRRVAESQSSGAISAKKSLLPIYINEKLFPAVIALVDTLTLNGPLDPSSLLFNTRGLIELGHFNEAQESLSRLKTVWDRSPLCDSCGSCEALYLQARIFQGRGDMEGARECLVKILSAQVACKSNGYYQETLSAAKSLLKNL